MIREYIYKVPSRLVIVVICESGMEDATRLHIEYELAVLRHHNDLNELMLLKVNVMDTYAYYIYIYVCRTDY